MGDGSLCSLYATVLASAWMTIYSGVRFSKASNSCSRSPDSCVTLACSPLNTVEPSNAPSLLCFRLPHHRKVGYHNRIGKVLVVIQNFYHIAHTLRVIIFTVFLIQWKNLYLLLIFNFFYLTLVNEAMDFLAFDWWCANQILRFSEPDL